MAAFTLRVNGQNHRVDVDPDTPGQRGLQRFFPTSDPADASGTIGAWAWGLQRAVDYLVTAPGIDPRRIVVTGHSRLGKAALLAAAFDERIALAIPHQAGCGGSAPSRARIAIGKPFNTLDTPRTKPPETVADINDAFPHWFNGNYKLFNDAPERLPFDQHCLVALCAPRPVLFTNAQEDEWANPDGQFEVLKAADPVYRFLGAGEAVHVLLREAGVAARDLGAQERVARGVGVTEHEPLPQGALIAVWERLQSRFLNRSYGRRSSSRYS